MRIPIWPGVRLSVWVKQNPDAVRVVMPSYHKPFTVRRALSKRGWMFLYVRYDPADDDPEKLRATLERVREQVALLCECCGTNRERMAYLKQELGLDTEVGG